MWTRAGRQQKAVLNVATKETLLRAALVLLGAPDEAQLNGARKSVHSAATSNRVSALLFGLIGVAGKIRGTGEAQTKD